MAVVVVVGATVVGMAKVTIAWVLAPGPCCCGAPVALTEPYAKMHRMVDPAVIPIEESGMLNVLDEFIPPAVDDKSSAVFVD